jgi:hypothetical protein
MHVKVERSEHILPTPNLVNWILWEIKALHVVPRK